MSTNPQDWDEIEALRASLREHMAEIHRHMAEIHRLRAAGRQALDALERAGEQLRGQSIGQAQHDLRSALKPVTDCHDKEGDNLPPSLDVPETNFGNMAQTVDCYGDGNVYRGQRSRDSETKTITFSKVETVEPVAYVTGYFDGRCVIKPIEPVFLPTRMALYRSPPKREPLTDEEIRQIALDTPIGGTNFARAIERAHGIGGSDE